MVSVGEQVKEGIVELASANRDFLREIIPQPRSPEVDLESPFNAPNLESGIRKALKNLGATDTALRTLRGDIARDNLRVDESHPNPMNYLDTVSQSRPDLMLESQAEKVDQLGILNLRNILAAQGKDLTDKSTPFYISSGLGNAYFAEFPNDTTIDITKIPDKFTQYINQEDVAKNLEGSDKKRIKEQKRKHEELWRDGFFYINLATVTDKLSRNRYVHPIAQATLKNYLKHETQYWENKLARDTKEFSELAKPTLSRLELQKKLEKSREAEFGEDPSPELTLGAAQFYALEDSIHQAEGNKAVYAKYQEVIGEAIKNYVPEPLTESESAGYYIDSGSNSNRWDGAINTPNETLYNLPKKPIIVERPQPGSGQASESAGYNAWRASYPNNTPGNYGGRHTPQGGYIYTPRE